MAKQFENVWDTRGRLERFQNANANRKDLSQEDMSKAQKTSQKGLYMLVYVY